jgi:hypothetical protein
MPHLRDFHLLASPLYMQFLVAGSAKGTKGLGSNKSKRHRAFHCTGYMIGDSIQSKCRFPLSKLAALAPEIPGNDLVQL